MHGCPLVFNSTVHKTIVSKGGWKEVKRGRHYHFSENSVIPPRPTIPTPPEDQVEEDEEDEAEPTTKEPEVIKIKKKRLTAKNKQVQRVAKRACKVKNQQECLQAASELFDT